MGKIFLKCSKCDREYEYLRQECICGNILYRDHTMIDKLIGKKRR